MKTFNKNDERRIRKFIFRWLPTNKRLQLHQKVLEDTCLSCNTCIESHTHLLKCTHIKRQNIKDAWFTKFENFLDNERYTPPFIKTIFYNSMYNQCYPISKHPIQDLPTDIQRAYNDQEQIGMSQISQGRLAFRWGNIIANHLASQRVPEKEMSDLIWGCLMTKDCLQLILAIWNRRNEDAHIPLNKHESQLTKRRLMAQIVHLHSERDYVFKSISILETYSVCNLQAWFKQASSIVTANKLRIQRDTKSNRHHYIRNSFIQSHLHDPDNPLGAIVDNHISEVPSVNVVSPMNCEEEPIRLL